MKNIQILDNLLNKTPKGIDTKNWVFCMNKQDFISLKCCKSYKGFKVMVFSVCPKGQVYFSPNPFF